MGDVAIECNPNRAQLAWECEISGQWFGLKTWKNSYLVSVFVFLSQCSLMCKH